MMEKYVIKHTISRSPLIDKIYPNFKVNVAKRMAKTTILDKSSLLSISSSSQIHNNNNNTESYDFDNDDFDVDELLLITKPTSIEEEEEEREKEIVTIDVLLKDSSISVDNLDNNFNLPYTVRSSCHLKSSAQDDDTLLISLKTGYALLIKFYKVDNVIKPMVIQSVDLRMVQQEQAGSFYHSQLQTLGRDVISMQGIILITAQSCNLKFCSFNDDGIITSDSINFFIDGQILMSCFIEINHHLMFLTLIITSTNKLQFRLFEKWNDEFLKQINQYSPILLSSNFEIPIFLTSINELVVLIYSNSITLLGLNYLISYDLKDCQSHDNLFGSPITNFQIPSETISQHDEILISTSNGSIYSVAIINLSTISINLIYEIPSMPLIHTFTITKIGDEDAFKLIYSTFNSSSEIIKLDNSFNRLNLEEKLLNWAPIIDHCIITTNKVKDEELWILGNQNKKTSLYQLRKGYKLKTSINDVFFKNFDKIHNASIKNVNYFVFEANNHCELYVYSMEELQLLEIEDFELEMSCLLFTNINDDTAIHITASSITVYDFIRQRSTINYRLTDKKIVMADSKMSLIGIIFQDDEGCLNLEIFHHQDDSIVSIFTMALASLQPSMLKFYEDDGKPFLTIGFFNNDLITIDVSDKRIISLLCLTDLEPSFEIPHDLIFISAGYLVISSRNGYYGIIHTAFKSKFIKLSNVPIKLIPHSEDDFLLVSKSIFRVSILKSYYPLGCYFTNQIGSNNKVNDLIYLPDEDEIITVGITGLQISNMSHDDKDIIVNKRIKLNKNCKLVFDFKMMKMFIVLTGSKFNVTSDHQNDDEPLIFINQINKKKLKLVELNFLESDEIIITVEYWQFEYSNDKGETKCHLQLLVSCFNEKTKTSCIKVVELKRLNNDEISMTKLFQWACTTNEKVKFIKQFTNDVIVYCLKTDFYKIRYDFELKKFEKPEFIISAKGDINKLTVLKDDKIILTTLNDDIIILKYDPTTGIFQPNFNDLKLNDIYDSLILDDGTTFIVIDKYDTVLKIYDLQKLHKPPIVYKTDSLLKLSKCQFNPRWDDTKKLRFIGTSLNGDISIFTIVGYSVLKWDEKDDGLFDLKKLDDWFINNDVKIVEIERLDDIEFGDPVMDGFAHSLII